MALEDANGLGSRFFAGPRRLIWKSCEDGSLFFDMDSGETKLVSPLARYLIVLLGASPSGLSVSVLVDLVHAEEPDVDMQTCRDEVGEALETLLVAGLLRTAACAG